MRYSVGGVAAALLLGASVIALPRNAKAYPPLPGPRAEVVPVAPGPGYRWRPGYWAWNGRGYAWVPGLYVVRRPAYHEWVPGHWEPRGRWIPEHWR